MKNKILIILMIFLSTQLFAQEPENLLETDSTWSRELFNFPLSFAPEINYEGIEEAVFPPNWGKVDSSEFWSYAFVWNVNQVSEITPSELEEKLQIYFDGLMQVKSYSEEDAVTFSKAVIYKKKDANGKYYFEGTVGTYDAFRTKKPMTLNVLVEQEYCELNKKSMILFKFSPKDFDEAVWQKLEKVKLLGTACDY